SHPVQHSEHADDPTYARFFCYIDVFIFSMLLLVLAGNFVFLIVGWAMVGLSSYLLIGFWYQRHSAVVAARKAFVMNVIGDVGMILGTFVLFVTYKGVTYSHVFTGVRGNDLGFAPGRSLDSANLELAAFLLLVGAVAKSAQLPLHTCLPDAMEGPTTVSALIHAATMVKAGVYLTARSFIFLVPLAPGVQPPFTAILVIAGIGGFTAIFAATMAVVNNDIKRVLA